MLTISFRGEIYGFVLQMHYSKGIEFELLNFTLNPVNYSILQAHVYTSLFS